MFPIYLSETCYITNIFLIFRRLDPVWPHTKLLGGSHVRTTPPCSDDTIIHNMLIHPVACHFSHNAQIHSTYTTKGLSAACGTAAGIELACLLSLTSLHRWFSGSICWETHENRKRGVRAIAGSPQTGVVCVMTTTSLLTTQL